MWWAVGWGVAFGTSTEENGFNQFFGPGSFFGRGEEFEDEAGSYGSKNGYYWALWLFQVMTGASCADAMRGHPNFCISLPEAR